MVIEPLVDVAALDEMAAIALGGEASTASSLRPVMSPQNIRNISNNKSTTVNFTGNYSSSPIVTDSSTLTKILAGYA